MDDQLEIALRRDLVELGHGLLAPLVKGQRRLSQSGPLWAVADQLRDLPAGVHGVAHGPQFLVPGVAQIGSRAQPLIDSCTLAGPLRPYPLGTKRLLQGGGLLKLLQRVHRLPQGPGSVGIHRVQRVHFLLLPF